MIRNRELLCAHGLSELRAVLLDVLEAGLRASAPRTAVTRTLALADRRIELGDRHYALADYDRVLVLGAGKASGEVLLGLEDVLGELLTGGVVAVPAGQGPPGEHAVRVLEADHPLPSERSIHAADELLAVARSAGRRDLIFGCFTGGSSALASKPPHGVSFEAKRDLHELLLSSGAPINEVNATRKHVSAFKAGRLAVAAAPATIVNLTVCDVVGCAHDLLTDPTVADSSTTAEAVEVLHRHGIWDAVAPSIRSRLGALAEAESPSLADIDIETVVMVTADTSARAMAGRASALGYRPIVLGAVIEGEARVVGEALAREALAADEPRPCVVIATGGEATVSFPTRRAAFGLGGPNQELALGAALALDGDVAAIAAIDSDGSDGGGRYAGAVADGLTVRRAVGLGVDLRRALESHSATASLAALGDVVDTGPTGTNVNDLVAIAVA